MTPLGRTAAFALHAFLLPMLGLAFTLAGLTHEAPTGGWVGVDMASSERPSATPTWESHGPVKGCHAIREGEVADVVAVVTQSGDTERMGFDQAWTLATDDERANDVYVIGACG